jgi:hypothetical protein
MLDVLSKAISFIAIIVIGYVMKRRGAFSEGDYKVLSKIVLNITLPCAVISSFAHFKLDYSLFVAVLIGFLFNVLMMLVGIMLTRRDNNATKIFYIFCLAGCNIGCFAMPFVQAFMSDFAVIAICMFDVGNSIMCTGLTYALTASCIGYADGRREEFSMGNIAKKLLHSTPFMVYMIMLVCAILNIQFPAAVYTFTSLVGSANAFLSMLIIGMIFEIALDRRALGYVAEVFTVRYVIAGAIVAGITYFAPFTPEVNAVLVLAFLAPCTIIGPIFVDQLGANVALAGFFNSITILFSVLLFTFFFIFMHV